MTFFRVYEIEQWKSTLQELLDRLDREMSALKEEKASTERELEQLNMPLLVCSECLSNRDGRRSSELTYDLADTELKKVFFNNMFSNFHSVTNLFSYSGDNNYNV